MVTFEEWAARAIDLEVAGLRLSVHDEGAGPVVTFLHGYPSSSLDAVPLFDRLDGEARLVTLDLPGFGASAKPPEHPYSIHGATDAVEGVWEQLGVPSTIVVAHDYSVSVAQELLARRADGALAVELTGVVWMNGGLYPDLHRQT
ncbi:MAG: alpha/beta fold hydrolase, partial [Acidimicrobiales bacterium]